MLIHLGPFMNKCLQTAQSRRAWVSGKAGLQLPCVGRVGKVGSSVQRVLQAQRAQHALGSHVRLPQRVLRGEAD